MGTKRNVDMSANTDSVKIVKADDTVAQENTESSAELIEATTENTTGSETAEAGDQSSEKNQKKATKANQAGPARSKKYNAARAQVDRTRTYDAFAAIELAKRLSYSKFDGTITADGLVRDEGDVCDIVFPHTTGEARKVAIVNDELLKEIEAGKIDFDILLSSPEYMPKLAKLARVLGPKGLMPNPKNGTLTPNPEAKMKEFAAGKMTIKTQRKMPVFHVKLGKASMDTKQLVENLQELIARCDTKLIRLTVSATMGPGVRVEVAGK